jgi:DNA-binding MarR family transcriptional regulator
MSARSTVLPPAGLTDPWLARVWRAFRAKSLSPSHLRILVALHEVAAGGTTGTQLAERTGYSQASVSIALNRARALGLVHREASGPRQVLFRPLRSR